MKVLGFFVESIVYVIGQLGVGGTERQLWHLVRGLDRSRWQPGVICLSDSGPMAAEFEAINCPVQLIPRATTGNVRAFRSLRQILQRVRPSIVQVFGFAWYLAIPAASLARVPHLIVAERTIPPWKKPWHIWTDRLMLPQADRAIVNSKKVRDDLVRVHGMPPDRCRLVYNGVDLNEFDALPRFEGIKSRVNESPIICAVANAKEDKQLDLLIRAFAIANAQLPTAVLWIVGDGPLRETLERQTVQLGIDKQVRFWGNREDLPGILRQASIGVNSSRVEGLCNAILEYMAASLPVVATDVGGNSELVVHDESGLLVPPGEPKALADALVKIARNAQLATSFGNNGRSRVEREFRMERMVAQTEKVYQELLA